MSRREFRLDELREFQTDARREAHHFQKMLMNAYDVDGLATQLLESRAALAAADARCREAQEQAAQWHGAWVELTDQLDRTLALFVDISTLTPDRYQRWKAYGSIREEMDLIASALTLPNGHPPPDAGGTATPGREQMLVSLIREVLDREPVYLHDGATSNDDTCCVFCDALTCQDTDNGNPHEPDCWIVRADAVVNAYSTDAGAAKEQEANTFQRIVGEWADATFPRSTADSICAHLSDEVAELANGTEKDAFEAADCYLLLLHLAHKEGFPLIDIAQEKFAINQRRQWGKPDQRGVTRHVDDPPAPALKEPSDAH